MDYQALARILPQPAQTWNEHQVGIWLQFVHLDSLCSIFAAERIHGPRLLSLAQSQLSLLGVSNNITQRKILRWIKEGFAEFAQHLACDNKENVPPLQRKDTTAREVPKRPLKTLGNREESMVVRSCDGNLAAFYVMKERSLKIGRSSANTIRSLEVSVENEHAQISRVKGRYYLRDCGTEAGTFIKITHPQVLHEGTLVEMGSFLMETMHVDRANRLLALEITHMGSRGRCDLTIALQDGCSFYSFGRRKNNNFSFDDEHLSGMHARIFLLNGEFVLEDLHSTNGTWLRLSKPCQSSGCFPLEEGSTFKVGTTITYQCEGRRGGQEKMEAEYDDQCASCMRAQRNSLFLPCRHNTLCSNCAQGLTSCPLCSAPVEQNLRIYI